MPVKLIYKVWDSLAKGLKLEKQKNPLIEKCYFLRKKRLKAYSGWSISDQERGKIRKKITEIAYIQFTVAVK